MLALKRMGYADSALRGDAKRLRMIARGADLEDPESVKAYIANKEVEDSFKQQLVWTYNRYAKVNGISWVRPKYRRKPGLPRPPTQEAITKVISSCTDRYATIFTLLSETEAMPAELHKVRARDIDLERATITLPGLKGHQPRVINLKPQLIAMLTRYLKENPGDRPFPKSNAMRQTWMRVRGKTAEKMQDPSLRRIRLYDLRHYFATMTYFKTKDILYTKYLMGHSQIETTLIYTQLVNFKSDEWASAVAKTIEEVCKLVEAGFEYVIEMNGVKIFRKRK